MMKQPNTLLRSTLAFGLLLMAQSAQAQSPTVVIANLYERVPHNVQAGTAIGYQFTKSGRPFELGVFTQRNLLRGDEAKAAPNERFTGFYGLLPLGDYPVVQTSLWVRSGIYNNGAFVNTIGVVGQLKTQGPIRLSAQLGMKKYRPTLGLRLTVKVRGSYQARFR